MPSRALFGVERCGGWEEKRMSDSVAFALVISNFIPSAFLAF